MCDKKRGMRSMGERWWWNEDVVDAHKVICRNSTEENKKRYKCMENKAN